MRPLVLAFFFISGLCGLLYEVVWIRVAGTVIGNTTYALGTVVGVFMGGLALGAWWGGRAADRRQGGSLLRLYGLLEAGIALSAALVPFLIAASEPIFRLLWNSVGEIAPLYAALRVLLVGIVLIVPTTLMGATLPVLSRFLCDSGEEAARHAGLAYAVNTFGGVAGTLLSGFWLIPTVGLRATTWVAVALNLAIGVASVAVARGRSGEVSPSLPPEPRPRPLALWVAAFSGFSALVYEVTWTRSLILSMGSTVYAFTLILTAFILGLAAGSAVSARFVSRFRHPLPILAALQAAIGLAAIVLLPILGDLPLRVAPIVEAHRSDYGAILRAESRMIALFVLLPTLLIGAVFPLAFRLAAGPATAVGRSVAAVYTWNTVGSIAGSVAASFLLVPTIGLAASILLAATVNLALSAFILLRDSRRTLALAPVMLAMIAWFLPSWDPRVLASGAYLYAAGKTGPELRKHLESESTIVGEYWDAYGLTTVHRSARGALAIRVNGKNDASTTTEDMPTQRTVGHLGLLHHPAPKRVLVIGLGSGVTLGAVARHPVERIDCVEISPAGVRASAHFTEANGRILQDPRVRLTIGDGRNAVLFAREPYDVIVSQPSNLWVSGMASLFTRDHFESARGRLGPGGIYCQWVHAYRLPLEDFQAILRTFFAVFPEGSLWEVFPGQDYILLGSAAPLRVPWPDLERRLGAPFHFEEFRGADLLLGRWIADAATVRSSTGPSPLITDDLSTIEYSTSRAMFTRLQPRILSWLDEIRKRPLPLDAYPGSDAARVSEARERRRSLASLLSYEAEKHAAHEVLERLQELRIPLADDAHVRDYFDSIALYARLDARTLRMGGKYPLALRVLRSIPKESTHYPDALFDRADVAERIGNLEEKARCVRALRTDYPDSFAGTCLQAAFAEHDSSWPLAERKWRDALLLRADSDYVHAQLASLLAKLGRREEAREACARALDLDPANALARRVLDGLAK